MKVVTRWARKRQWEKKYVAMLSQIGDEPKSRIEAHAKNLHEYWLRWLGFCRLEAIDPQSLVENDLFLVVEAASKIADMDIINLLRVGKDSIGQVWREYQNALRDLRKCSPDRIKINAEQCYLKFEAFENTVLPG